MAATTKAGTAMMPMQIQYHFSACSAYRHDPLLPQTMIGMMRVMQKMMATVFRKVSIWR